MANVLVNDLYLSDIADAIRGKLGVQTTYKPSEMANAIGNISGGGSSLGTKSITANGTYNASSDSLDGYSQVTVNVPNTYSAGDEGKVVSSGALVAQTSDTVTENDTYDTTLINSLTVNVSGGGGSGTLVTVTSAKTNANACLQHLLPTIQSDHIYIGCLYNKSTSNFITNQLVAFSLNGASYSKGSGLRWRGSSIDALAGSTTTYDAQIDVGDQFMIYDFSVA